jgi:hypothetical protein
VPHVAPEDRAKTGGSGAGGCLQVNGREISSKAGLCHMENVLNPKQINSLPRPDK